MVNLFQLIFVGITIYFIWKFIRWIQSKQKRYIPQFVKNAVLKRYFGMCAICTETLLLEFHHREEYSKGGDNSEKNIVPLCPKHHAMVTRMEEK